MSMEAEGSDLSPDLEREVESCKRLIGQGAGQQREIAPSEIDALDREVRGLLAAERGPIAALRALPTWQRSGLVIGLSALVTAGALLLRPRPDLASYPADRMVATLVLLFAITASAGWRLLRPLHLPAPSRWSGLALLGAGMLVPFFLSVVPLGHEGHAAGEGWAFTLGCARCLGFGGMLGLPVLLVAFAVRRAEVDGAALGALAGVAAGLTGNLALQVHCPITHTAHLLIGHATLIIVLGTAAFLWRRFL